MENRTLIAKQAIVIGLLFFLFACDSGSPTAQEMETVEQDSTAAYPYELILDWEAPFNEGQQEMHREWIQEVYDATLITMGEYPFDVYVHFLHSSSTYSPVPFGYTSRKKKLNEVYLYVNPDATLEELRADWTAPHELSHLAITAVGPTAKWFAEGFATFFSRQTMMEMGYYTQAKFDSLYRANIDYYIKPYKSTTSTFIEVADSLVSKGSYGAMYWGSSSFMMALDVQLRTEKEMHLKEVLQGYQSTYRLEDRNLRDVVGSFDKVMGETWCNDLMKIYRNEPSINAVNRYYELVGRLDVDTAPLED